MAGRAEKGTLGLDRDTICRASSNIVDEVEQVDSDNFCLPINSIHEILGYMDSQGIPPDSLQQETPPSAQPASSINQPQSQPLEQPRNNEDNKTIITVIILLFAYPIGLVLMWFWTKWPKWAKVLISLPFFLAILGILAVVLLSATNQRF